MLAASVCTADMKNRSMASFAGRKIAVTGAASGIGLATAELLASRGANLTLIDCRAEPLEQAVQRIQKRAPTSKIHSRVVDVVKRDEVESWLDEASQVLGDIDGAANVAGISGAVGQKTIAELTDLDFDSVLDVNLKGTFNCLRAQLQRMGAGSSIVNTASVAGLQASNRSAPYAVSKHGVIALTKNAAVEFGPSNIRVNAVAPGPIETPMVEALMSQASATVQEEIMKSSRNRISLGRGGQPLEVAFLIAFLLSGEATFTTGSIYTIDGGWTAC